MNITIYKNNSDSNVLGKNITAVTGAIPCVWKEETGLLQPTVILNNIQGITKDNFVYIDDFDRYYFINDVRPLPGGRIELVCMEDYLSSWETELRQQTAVIARQANLWNLYLDDQNYRVYSNPIIQLKDFPDGFNTYQYVLLLAGGQ